MFLTALTSLFRLLEKKVIYQDLLVFIKLQTEKNLLVDCFEYQMKEVIGKFDDLKERVIIKWSNAIPRGINGLKTKWKLFRYIQDCTINSLQIILTSFLNFDELKEIVSNQYSDWKKVLSITKAYLSH